ncbi:hypothetical protein PILCRDRAFT_822369, partial [Piloderma croceum F 1598]
ISYVRLSGHFADLPATVVVDTSVAESSVSMTYANNNNVPRDVTSISSVTHFSCSGPVTVPAGPGWFHSRMPFKMAYHNHCDILLGVDWITACQPVFAHGGILPLLTIQTNSTTTDLFAFPSKKNKVDMNI